MMVSTQGHHAARALVAGRSPRALGKLIADERLARREIVGRQRRIWRDEPDPDRPVELPLVELIRRSGFRRADVARLSGLPYTTVWGVCWGNQRMPGLETLRGLGEALGEQAWAVFGFEALGLRVCRQAAGETLGPQGAARAWR